MARISVHFKLFFIKIKMVFDKKNKIELEAVKIIQL